MKTIKCVGIVKSYWTARSLLTSSICTCSWASESLKDEVAAVMPGEVSLSVSKCYSFSRYSN
jgi:hypothetical protein